MFVQTVPSLLSSVKPVLHAQVNEPMLSVHVASVAQL